MPGSCKVLLVDLNNFARYPTIPIGYLAAILRQAGMEVSVFSPLSHGISGVVREPGVKPWGLLDQRARYWSSTTKNPAVRRVREFAQRHVAAPALKRNADKVIKRFRQHISAENFDIVLVSTYLMYFDICEQLGLLCQERSIPMIIGGPYFAQPEVRKSWCNINGLTALVGGEVELQLPEIVERAITGRPMADIVGVWEPGTWNGGEAAPLPALDLLPFPDFSDFPWAHYPERIVPLITGRGCGWGACTFCSDVTSTAGRKYRSRSPQNVCDEISFQHEKHDARLFVFTDLKMNSSQAMWGTLLERFQTLVPDGRWVGSIHVDAHRDNGLSAAELKRAALAGMVRLTTGLESGSQRVLDLMKKGVELNKVSAFLHNAAAAGISVRVTMIVGYPGEQADDLRQTADFLKRHAAVIERVLINRFQLMSGTRIHQALDRFPERHSKVTDIVANHRVAQIDHHFQEAESPAYRRQITEVLRAAHHINRRPLRPAARAFEGVM